MKGESYRVTIDYINADTINVRVLIKKSMLYKDANGNLSWEEVDLFVPSVGYVTGSEVYDVFRVTKKEEDKKQEEDIKKGEDTKKEKQPIEYNIPVYVGIGLRVSANVYITGANANISGIGIIGAEAEAEKLKGSLVVQTLGVNGKSVAAALPIQSELNRTTAQNAIVAVGSIKALLYADETIKQPRVVGLYLPFPGGKPLVNAIISALSKEPVVWDCPCRMQKKPPSK